VLHVHKVGSNHIGIKECAVGGVVCMARVDGMLRFAPHSQIWSVHLYLLCNRLVSLCMLLAVHRQKEWRGCCRESHHGELHELVVVEARGRGCYSQASDGNLSRHS
jgi:hypothetical protein